ncbi:hypothetical protein [Streptomyces bathyalis]|uniref:hypothetical protein n=1 Tax=Streptomyces bathyalis TaxID=2710756 RepID=UPI001FEC7FF3|nr:hypothetical protein [Streptomyces bathyalis]
MPIRKPTTAVTTALLAASLAGASLAGASPASAAEAAGYHCKTSSKSIDDPGYSGPWADNWDITVKLCAKRSGSHVRTVAKVAWDGPVYAKGTRVFDGANVRLQAKKSKAGNDPVIKGKTFRGIKSRLNHSDSNGNHNGRYDTGRVTAVIKGKARADGKLRLNWNNDGRGYRTYFYAASPRV